MIELVKELITIKKRFIIITICFFLVCLISSHFIKRTYTKTEYGIFDTICQLTVTDSKDNTEKYMQILRSIDKELDVFDTDSATYNLNKNGEAIFTKNTYDHLLKAIDYSKAIPMYFDISLNPVSLLWNDAITNESVPGNIENYREFIGIENIITDNETNTVKIIKDDASVTFGATAKGYATKTVLDEIIKDKVKSALINLGGNIYAHGRKPDGSKWTVGIADPKNPATSAVTLEAEDIAVITSGDYERYFEKDGKRYHHIIDPKTLMPAESGIHSATAIGKDPELCDIMSTALFVAGIDGAKELVSKYEIDAILITDDTVYYTSGVKELIKDFDENYMLIML